MNLFGYLTDPAHWTGDGLIPRLLLQHLAYTASAVVIAAVVAVPLGIWIGHSGRGLFLVRALHHGLRAVPALGLLFLAVLLLGSGAVNVVVVLALLAVPVLLSATAIGVAAADRDAVYAGRALGLTAGQVVRRVEWPLALPQVLTGVRRATVQVVATATVAAFVSGGGLGRLLTAGQAQRDYPQMFAGALLVTALAVLLHLLLAGFGWLATRRARPARRLRGLAPAAA
ncbi:MAG: putative osmoprotectant transporter permease protein [Friedmanniella sp.]|nr:putative osmoprotectant transporter permease protein [Friedmanniella sp.]